MSEQIQIHRQHPSSSERAQQEAVEQDEAAIQAAQEAEVERIADLRTNVAVTLAHIDLLVA